MKERSAESKNVREYRRLRAVELFNKGMKAIKIAEILGITRGAVSQWLKRYRGTRPGLPLSPVRHVQRLMRKWGWSPQNLPMEETGKRRDQQWPEIKKPGMRIEK